MYKMLCMLLIIYGAIPSDVEAYPTQLDEGRYVERDYASPGAHQLASWIASQMRPKEFIPPQDIPILPYRLPAQGKRNSEVSNAIIGSEETQKMYRDGRK
ncbi:unnamed protein product [Brassicogethes aeneus]|uniref:Uncharacterized protein n=1 Tax=Brassicogethes aeneus TaxID=1431903 RepID=A0A9P0B6U3_BRAAE|nr:unnamed protein product [Brassicogethes aeneus]